MLVIWSLVLLLSVSFSEQGLIDSIQLYKKGFLGSKKGIDGDVAEDARLTTPELIAKYDYEGEVHSVITEDGYILELHRISGSPKSPSREGKKVLFLMHGLKAQSKQWVLTGPAFAQAFQLADEGYDVWMGNSRGTDLSLNHTTYKPFGNKYNQKQYWTYSWHEIGVIDLPTMIDYVLEQTGQQKLQYVGHSQGCTTYFVMMSEKPEMNEKIIMMHAMAPAVFLGNIKVPTLLKLTPRIDAIRKLNQLAEVYHLDSFDKRLETCRDVKAAAKACVDVLLENMGRPSDQTNLTQIPIIFSNYAAHVSTNQAMHFGQNVKSKQFRKFDFGEPGNKRRYGQKSPPAYNLENAKSPVAVYYGESDWFVVPKDARRLISELPNVVLDYLVPHKAFNHGDFLYGIDARKLVFDKVLEMIKSAEANE